MYVHLEFCQAIFIPLLLVKIVSLAPLLPQNPVSCCWFCFQSLDFSCFLSFPKLQDCSWEIEGHPFHGHVELVCRHLFGPQETTLVVYGGVKLVKMTRPERSHWGSIPSINMDSHQNIFFVSVVKWDLKPLTMFPKCLGWVSHHEEFKSISCHSFPGLHLEHAHEPRMM